MLQTPTSVRDGSEEGSGVCEKRVVVDGLRVVPIELFPTELVGVDMRLEREPGR